MANASRDLAGAGTPPASSTPGSASAFTRRCPSHRAPWASRAPRLPDPERQAHLAEIAAMMDDRDAVPRPARRSALARMGVAALGPVPADPAGRARDHTRSGRHEEVAASYRAMRDHYRQQEAAFAKIIEDRLEWEHTTVHSRHLAIAADAELRRRKPDQQIEPLRSAEPAPVSDTEREQLFLAADQ